MAENSKIEWTDHTFNPWLGCEKVSPACANCYAESWAKRTGNGDLWKGVRRRTSEANWRKPRQWNAQARMDRIIGRPGRRPRVFVASLADVFEDLPELEEIRRDLFTLIAECPELDWLLLTKRPENFDRFLPWDTWRHPENPNPPDKPWPHVWLGTTAEDQKRAGPRIWRLVSAPAAVHFVSIEPMLTAIDLRRLDVPMNIRRSCGRFYDALGGSLYDDPGDPEEEGIAAPSLDWVIVGGESGARPRPMHPEWVRSIRDDCIDTGVPFLFKQWGELAPAAETDELVRIGKKKAGRILDGRTWDQFPVSPAG